RSQYRTHPAVLFFASIMVFALLIGLLISFTREVSQPHVPMESRYATFAIHFWIGLIGLIAFHFNTYPARKITNFALASAVAVMAIASIYTSKANMRFFYLYDER